MKQKVLSLSGTFVLQQHTTLYVGRGLQLVQLGRRRCFTSGRRSVVVVTVHTQDVTAVGEEARAHQRHGTAGALEAWLVPLPVLKGDVLPISEACGAQHEGRGSFTGAL